MTKRLSEAYTPGDLVEITFGEEQWLPAQVVQHAPPGVWVRTQDGRFWFVTNTRRIRHARQAGVMRPEIAERLIALNREFYAALSHPFAESRRRPQPGFERLSADFLPADPITLLDVGCGEGRFGRYLQTKHQISRYVGVDFTADLLARAQASAPGEFMQRDLSQPGCLDGLDQFDVVACLATMQHIPGQNNRLRLLREMKACLKKNGRLLLANWQFMDSDRQRRKVRDWAEIGLTPEDVESNDYLLTWQRSGFGLRYVCQIDAVETAELAALAGLLIRDQFRSDGKEGNLTLYTILGKPRKVF